jgi:hypothetical protein
MNGEKKMKTERCVSGFRFSRRAKLGWSLGEAGAKSVVGILGGWQSNHWEARIKLTIPQRPRSHHDGHSDRLMFDTLVAHGTV